MLAKRRLLTAADLQDVPNGRLVRYCGIVTLRQQPETAKGTIFVSLEDETGVVQVICWKRCATAQRNELLQVTAAGGARDLAARGRRAQPDRRRLEDLTPMLGRLATASRDFKMRPASS